MNFFERRKVFKNTNALDLVPIRKVEHQIEEGGNITIIIPKFRNDKFAKFALGNRKRHIFIHLDEIGTFTWLLIDGISNIRVISEKLKDHFGESLLESEQRVNKFMSRLYQERYITFRQLEVIKET
jgi:hypothetical protein